MAFVKLDCGILNSTLWVEREQRDVFITALLMAVPFEVERPLPQLEVGEIRQTGFLVPPGWYGFVQAAGPGIVRRAMADPVLGMQALKRLGEPDPESRSSDFDGRRLVRVDGGYIILNYMRYRDKDNTAAARARRYRDRKREEELAVSRRDETAVTRDSSCGVTKEEEEAEAESSSTKNKARKRAPPVAVPVSDLVSAGFDEPTAAEYIAYKAAAKAPLTKRAWDDHLREAAKAGWTPQQAALKVMAKSWKGFEAAYVAGQPAGATKAMPINRQEALEQRNRAVGEAWLRDQGVA